MSHLKPSDFRAFFQELWNFDPFPWQERLAERVCSDGWPGNLDLPTGSGKTACIDIAIFGLAIQACLPPTERTLGRRIYFVVNRRVIVDEAHRRAGKIAKCLASGIRAESTSTVARVAEALRSLSPPADGEAPAPPLDAVQLRGGIYRDNRWARSITQPVVVSTTVDQIGSRLFFRGYGLSNGACPIHAALIAQDSLILIDEAHIIRPFVQTLGWVRQYREIPAAAGTGLTPLPFEFVQMSATQGPDSESGEASFALDGRDYADKILGPRLMRAKPATLKVAPGVSGKAATAKLAKALCEEAGNIIVERAPLSLAVMVNRVATARATAELLEAAYPGQVTLLIGRMRPLDRDREVEAIATRLKTGSRKIPSPPDADDKPPMTKIVVATQCLEVGADLDFDALVTECASLDALRQRFGRLNRSGDDFLPSAVIVMRADLEEPAESKLLALDEAGKSLDPVYGNALTRTWNWLKIISAGGEVDFSTQRMREVTKHLTADELELLNAPSPDAPVLMPAYLDAWAQTNPRPAPDPDPAIFLHGPDRGQPEVMVCWRSDLPADDGNSQLDAPLVLEWRQIISLCPPVSSECLSVPLSVLRDWLFNPSETEDRTSDLLSEESGDAEISRSVPQPRHRIMAWRGNEETDFVRSPRDLRPGITVVIPSKAGGWNILGYLPGAPPDLPAHPETLMDSGDFARVDLGDLAYFDRHSRHILRLTASLAESFRRNEPLQDLAAWALDANANLRNEEVRELLLTAAGNPDIPETLSGTLKGLADPRLGLVWTRYPGGKGVCLQNRRRTAFDDPDPSGDDGDDALSTSDSARTISLVAHTENVVEQLRRNLALLPMDKWAEPLLAAALCHDLGKADPRFQALLLRGDQTAAGALQAPIAKSPHLIRSALERENARLRSGLPKGFRHEMLSLQLAERSDEIAALSDGGTGHRDLALHLVASHHGYARPFAPVVIDQTAPDIEEDTLPVVSGVSITSAERQSHPPHHLGSGIAERFWNLAASHGWWGLAFLESVLRLSDQQASEAESRSAPK